MIELEGVTRRFGDFHAVRDLSFRVDETSGITALLGPNGAGKSTTMRLITGYLKATSGSIRISGMSMDDEDSVREIKRLIGYLPESSPLYPEMLVSEYLDFIGRVRGLEGAALRSASERMVDRLQLASHYHSPIGILSKGFRQRVALAGALIHDPRIIILDEPTSGLDPNQISQIRALIQELGKDRILILSTHILQDVQDICDRIIIISRGTIVADRPRAELQGVAAVNLVARGAGIKQALEASSIVASVDGPLGASNEFAQYRCHLGERHPEELFRFVAGQPWDVREFAPAVRSLQDIFHELTG